MSNEMEVADKQKKALVTIRTMLATSLPQIKLAMPRHMNAERLMRISITSCQKNPLLLECHPVTLIGAVIQSAQLGLEPDGVTGMAYLIPFYNGKKNRYEVQFMAGYKGLVALARRSQEIGPVESRIVHEKDKFKFQYGLSPKLTHTPSQEEDKGKVTHVYAIARWKEFSYKDFPAFEVMDIKEIEGIMNRSKSKNKEGQLTGPWKTDFEEMAKKTVLRRLCKLLPMSIEMQTAVALDEKAEAGLPQDLGTIIDTTEVGTTDDESPQPKAPVSMPKAKGQTKITPNQAGDFEVACTASGKTKEQVEAYLLDKIGSSKVDDILTDVFSEAMVWAKKRA